MKSPIRKLTWLVGVVAVFAIASAMGASAHTTKGSTAKAGGTLNVGWEQAFNFTDNGDPTGEYLGDWFGIADNLLVRTLIGYTHNAGGPGNTPVADIATAVPKPTNGGKTYTFHIKSGVMFSPPVSRQVTCSDFVNAMQRLANPKDGGQYSFYYTVIKGWSNYAAGKAKSISGITLPEQLDDRLQPDRPDRRLPEAHGHAGHGPAACRGHQVLRRPGREVRPRPDLDRRLHVQGHRPGRHLDCSALKPASGYDGQTQMDLVRNPNYKQSTDPTRKNYADEVRFLIDASNVDIYNKIEAGQFDLATSSIPNNVAARSTRRLRALKSHFFQNSGDRTWYLTMNVTQPPFDDIHVRRAMNWIIDKSALRQIWGGPTVGDIANHIVPDSLFGGQLADYKPYRTTGDHGSVAKASWR